MKFCLIFLLIFPIFSIEKEEKIQKMNSILQEELGINQTKKNKSNSEEKSEKTIDKKNTNSEMSFWNIVSKVLAFLILLVILLYFILFFFKKRNFGLKSNLIQTIDSFKLDTNKTINIIQIVNKIFVLGVSTNSVHLITEISSEEDKNQIYTYLQKNKNNSSKDTFLVSLLLNLKSKAKSFNSQNSLFEDTVINVSKSYQENQKNKIKKIKKQRNHLEEIISNNS